MLNSEQLLATVCNYSASSKRQRWRCLEVASRVSCGTVALVYRSWWSGYRGHPSALQLSEWSIIIMDKFVKRSRRLSDVVKPPAKRKLINRNLDLDLMQLYEFEKASQLFKQLEEQIQYNDPEQSRIQVFGRWHNIPRKQAAYADEGMLFFDEF